MPFLFRLLQFVFRGNLFRTCRLTSFLRAVIPAVMVAAGLSACENDVRVVNTISKKDTLPVESAKEIEVIFSDSGRVQILLTGPVYRRFEAPEPYMEFPKGFKVSFFDEHMNVKSQLSAGYGINFERKQMMEARNNVVFLNNEKGERLNTEHLVWDERRKLVFSDQFVKITTKDKVLFGEGLESDEKFENWLIRKPTGTFYLDANQ